jgi:small redox-active disulfide protein 2
MKIQILGSGCTKCKELYELTKKAVTELKSEAIVEHITDVSKIIEMGIMESPVLVINGKPAMIGTGNIDKIKQLITGAKSEITGEKSTCTCGGKC